jgi:hypothetical protein
MKPNENEMLPAETVNKKTGEIATFAPVLQQWEVDRQQAEALVKSGFLPPAINTVEKAVAIIFKGREIGIGPMEAFSSINIIQGKISVSPQLMLALARRTKELEAFDVKKDEKEAVVTIKRKGFDPVVTRFGIKEATALGLIGKDNYKKQPGIMFQWRALAENLRLTFGDAIAGMYTADELGLEMSEDGATHTITTRGTVSMPKPLEKPNAVETQVVA